MKKLDDVIGTVAYILDTLMAYRNIANTGRDCNQCAAASTCRYAPEPGQLVRHNCPLFVERENDGVHD